jgi:DNA-binding XRE family transcriptional regulator
MVLLCSSQPTRIFARGDPSKRSPYAQSDMVPPTRYAGSSFECPLKAVASKQSIGMIVPVKPTHKGPLRDVLARNMRKLRAAYGLSQEALAHESDVDRTYVSSIERAERGVSIDIVARIAKALAVEPWKLLKDG